MDRDTFPRQHARTRRFTLGAPRTFRVSPDGSRVTFLRSGAGDDPINRLWVLDVESGAHHVVADPDLLLNDDGANLPDAERRRRERAREAGGGIVGYAGNATLTKVVFALSGRMFVTDLTDGQTTEIVTEGAVFDPRFDRSGQRIAYVADGELRLVGVTEEDRALLTDDHPEVTWGSAEFIAAEEMGRNRGFWWAPDGDRLVVARADSRDVPLWHIADPANPGRPPVTTRYPAAGTTNATVTLHVVDLRSQTTEIVWERSEYPYVADVSWGSDEPLTLTVQSRDQRRVLVLTADPESGATTEVHRIVDDDWVELVPGSPTWHRGELITVEDDGAARRLMVSGQPRTSTSLQVRSIAGVLDGELLVAASPEPTETHLFAVSETGDTRPLTDVAGVHSGVAGGSVVVISTADMESPGIRATVVRDGAQVAEIESLAELPLVNPDVRFATVGQRQLHSAVLMPSWAETDEPLPVLLDPYGGPHAQRVVRSNAAFHTSQWFAEQGFAVVVIDGRGTPARGPAWERAVRGDLAGPVLDDQVDGLHALAETDSRLDLDRVAMRGWSFGGYLSALAVLRRPDVFHAAIAGAPVTDWRLYDTHYTERYLGHPDEEPGNYQRTDLTAEADALTRPLMLIHGLADDNVVVAHTLQLSGALLAAGRAHTVLPLSGVTHMTPQEVIAENLLKLQITFLRDALGLGPSPADT